MRDRHYLILACCLLAAAGAYRLAAGAIPAAETGGLEITCVPGPALSPTRSAKEEATISFAPAGAAVHGIAAAALYPVEDDRPAHLLGQNVVAVQKDGSLRLRSWIHERHPQQHGDSWLLHYALWCTADGRSDVIWWTGWCKVSIAELASSGIEVVPDAAISIDVAVRTTGGQPIPGASIAVDPGFQQPGFSLQYAATGKNGRITCRGLDDARDWSFSLLTGAGPARKPVHGRWRAGTDRRVELVVDLGGTWEYKPLHLIPAFRGATVTVRRMQGAWPTAGWIPAGRMPTTCYVMWPAGKPPTEIRTLFAGYPPHKFDVDKDAYLRLLPMPKNQKRASNEQKRKGS